MESKKCMRNIWFFVGLIVLVIGVIVFTASVYDLINPTNHDIKLSNLHTNIWWGALIAITGAIYIMKNRNKFVDM